MEIGLFFGSFNPIHTGHLIIANDVLNFTSVEKVCFVVSPQNPLKNSDYLLNSKARLKLTQLATSTDERFEVSDIELALPKPSYTINTLRRLKDEYPQNGYSLIIGSDNFLNFSSWKSNEAILREWKIIVYMRPGFSINLQTNFSRVKILSPTQTDISSSRIRELTREKKSTRYLVPEAVLKEITNRGYYK